MAHARQSFVRSSSAALVLALSAGAASSQTAFSWAAPVDGVWSDAANWSPAGSPGAFSGLDTAALGLAGPYTVTLDVSRIISGLSFQNPEALLQIERSDSLTMLGDITGVGRILVNDPLSAFFSTLTLGDGVTLADATVELNQPNTARLFGPTTSGERATIGPTATVTGSGRLSGLLDVEGTILVETDDLITLSLTDNLLAGGGTVDFAGGDIVWNGVTVTDMSLVGDVDIDRGESLTFGHGVVVEDTIRVNDPLSGLFATLFLLDGVTLSDITVDLDQVNTARLFGPTNAGERATVGGTAVVTGSGRLQGRLDIAGLIRLDPGETIRLGLDDNTLTGGGTVDFNGGELDWNGVTVTNMTLLGDVDIDRNESVTFGPGVVVESTIRVNDPFSGSFATLFLLDGVTLSDITVDLDQVNTARLFGPTADGERATVGATTVVTGSGTLDGLLDIAGVIELNTDERIRALTDDGLLTGGGVIEFNGGDIDWNGATVTNMTIRANADVDRGESVTFGPGVTVEDTFVINDPFSGSFATLNLLDGVTQNSGTFILDNMNNARIVGPTADGERATIGAGATVTGEGRLLGNLDIDGMILPGSELDPGTIELRLDSPATFGPTAELDIGFASDAAGSFGQLGNFSELRLGGTLRVRALDGFLPNSDNAIDVISGGVITGEFDQVIYQGSLGPDDFARVFYLPDRVVFAVTCGSDVAFPPGTLDLSDVDAFITAFLAQEPEADIAAPFGILDLADIDVFIGFFLAGCP